MSSLVATRSLRSKHGTPTRITTRNAREPRDEEARIPGSTPRRTRPSPINIVPGEPIPTLEAPSPCGRSSIELCESPRAPEVVDLAPHNTWPRRGPPGRQISKRLWTPSMVSERSARQSEQSFGILDYYMDRSPIPSPKLPAIPRIDTPVIDPAMDKFDFGLPFGSTDSPRARGADQTGFEDITINAKGGAEQTADPTAQAPAMQQSRASDETKVSYRLFPRVQNVTPSSKPTAGPSSPPNTTPASTISFVPSHPQPDASYRPRKESITSSVRSRKDSFTSYRKIPLRVFSSNMDRTNSTGSMSVSSPPQQSRWSDESTITSPLAATTPGPRTSFGSLLDGSSFPDSFFEDDDEDVPLRRKLLWKRSVSLTHEQKAKKAERFGERESFGTRFGRVLLCGGCCGQRL